MTTVPTMPTRERSQPKPRRTPLRVLLDIFSSVWTGVTLLVTLFVYSSLGSAVPAFRQLPVFEMTEFEWFNWWPFVLLIGLICLTLTVTTLRRIPLRPVNYGVWMIHSGIIVLSIGSVVYFGTKVEGDAPIARRQVSVHLPGEEPVSFVAMPGNSIEIGPPDRRYRLQVASIDPQWEILSGEDAGRRAYSVNVMVHSPEKTFMRQLLAGYPQYTEDLVRSSEPGPPWARAKKVTGDALVDDELELALEYATEDWFYLSNDIVKSWALYLREVPAHGPPGSWIERPIDGLPLYNDYVADLDDVWLAGGPSATAGPLHVAVGPVDPADPLPEVTFEVTSYLRYAVMDTRRRAGGDVFDPVVRIRVDSADGRGQEYELIALDPAERMEPGGRLVFEWMDTETDFDAMLEIRDPTLSIRVDAASVELEIPILSSTHLDPDLPFTAVEGTDYEWRVRNLHDDLRLPTGEVISVAAVEIRTPQRTWVRWVSDDPARTRDLPDDTETTAAHGQPLPLERGIVMEYRPGTGPAPITIAAGPADDELRLVVSIGGPVPRVERIAVGRPVTLTDTLRLTVLEYSAYTSLQSRPAIVPPSRRNKDMRARSSMIAVVAPGVDGMPAMDPVWLQFHHWPFDDAQRAFGRAMFRPTEVALPDGRLVELMFSRQRRRLPATVALDDFVMVTHAGGFSGQNISVVNWTSEIRFRNDDGWSEPLAVSVNDPQEHGGLWYFQAQWDPPDPAEGYAGLNYTVLGVGNRHGVNVMLTGCCVTVLGMIYAFYVKPFIRRRQQQAVYARHAGQRREEGREADADASGTAPQPVGVVQEQQ